PKSPRVKFTRRRRLGVLVLLGVVPPAVAIYGLQYTITATTPAAIQAAVAGGIITAIGTVSSAIYKEASSYFQQTDSNVDKKVTMITPLVEKYYNPWINAANTLAADLGNISKKLEKSKPVERDEVTHLLYGYLVYYGYRMRFILEAGGTILLTTAAEQKQVLQDYRDSETALDWKDTNIQESVSFLQDLFVTNGASINNPHVGDKNPSGTELSNSQKSDGKADDPTQVTYLFYEFKADAEKNQTLHDMVDELSVWAKDDSKVKAAKGAVENFANTFQDAIDHLFTAWGGE
ncbi:MAG: hypothetical protein OK456_01555, partial [Thaumarchaeota archaeon]|nr:hypothetical protein [Nitrososphaerota archaeon]